MTDAAPPPGMTRAEFYTGRYAIRGDVFTGNDRRLVDALRDSTRQYLEIKRHIGRGKPHGRTALQRAAQ